MAELANAAAPKPAVYHDVKIRLLPGAPVYAGSSPDSPTRTKLSGVIPQGWFWFYQTGVGSTIAAFRRAGGSQHVLRKESVGKLQRRCARAFNDSQVLYQVYGTNRGFGQLNQFDESAAKVSPISMAERFNAACRSGRRVLVVPGEHWSREISTGSNPVLAWRFCFAIGRVPEW